MVTDIFLDNVKIRMRKRWRTQKAINGHRFRKKLHQRKITDPKGKGCQWGLVLPPQGRFKGKGVQPLQDQILLKTLSKFSTLLLKLLKK
jgi:hypothetical protein